MIRNKGLTIYKGLSVVKMLSQRKEKISMKKFWERKKIDYSKIDRSTEVGLSLHEYSSMTVMKHSHPKWSNYWGSRQRHSPRLQRHLSLPESALRAADDGSKRPRRREETAHRRPNRRGQGWPFPSSAAPGGRLPDNQSVRSASRPTRKSTWSPYPQPIFRAFRRSRCKCSAK